MQQMMSVYGTPLSRENQISYQGGQPAQARSWTPIGPAFPQLPCLRSVEAFRKSCLPFRTTPILPDAQVNSTEWMKSRARPPPPATPQPAKKLVPPIPQLRLS